MILQKIINISIAGFLSKKQIRSFIANKELKQIIWIIEPFWSSLIQHPWNTTPISLVSHQEISHPIPSYWGPLPPLRFKPGASSVPVHRELPVSFCGEPPDIYHASEIHVTPSPPVLMGVILFRRVLFFSLSSEFFSDLPNLWGPCVASPRKIYFPRISKELNLISSNLVSHEWPHTPETQLQDWYVWTIPPPWNLSWLS